MRSNLFIIAKSGWGFVATSLALSAIFTLIDFEILAFVAFLASLFFLMVYRNPERELQNFEKDAIVSPVDGVVTAIEELDNSEYAYRVEIASGYGDVSLLRCPIEATLSELSLKRGARLSSKSALLALNESAMLVFTNSNNISVKIAHTLTQSFAPLDMSVSKGQRVLKGSRYGLMPCGISSIYLPKNVRVSIKPSMDVKASETLIGFFS